MAAVGLYVGGFVPTVSADPGGRVGVPVCRFSKGATAGTPKAIDA